MINGLDASFSHGQNGMTRTDMIAAMEVADRLQEVIIFRSTGPWAKRWLKRGYPSKNFHVKGKSSDWGPQAGLVPYDGTWSKVGYDTGKAAKGTQANIEGLASGFAARQVLILSMDQINEQLTVPEGNPPRTACEVKVPVPNSNDFLITARRSGDQKQVCFRAFSQGGGMFKIHVYAATGPIAASPFKVLDSDPTGAKSIPLDVMTSNEVGAGRPMTGDYDLMSVCPSWKSYGSLTSAPIVKQDIHLQGLGARAGQTFAAGVGLDNVMDQRLQTMGKLNLPGPNTNGIYTQASMTAKDFSQRKVDFQAKARVDRTGAMSPDSLKNYFGAVNWNEHADMGNLTPRILRCINELNVQMGATGANSAMRRVHHNAESHRSRHFGALTGTDLVTKKDGEQYGDGFPLTVFQPRANGKEFNTPGYYRVCTIETLIEFKKYAQALKNAGYYVPKNWVWGM
jgi:hypothetical protein